MLAAQEQQRVIGGVTYAVKPLPASVAMRLMARVLKMAAPAFADLAHLRDASKAVGAMLAGSFADLDESTLEYAQAELAKVTDVVGSNGARVPLANIFDVHFTGRVVEYLEWLAFASEVTFGPLAKRLTATEPSPKPAQQESAPQPG